MDAAVLTRLIPLSVLFFKVMHSVAGREEGFSDN